MTFINAAHIEAAVMGRDREPVDNRSPNSAPSDFIPTQDGKVVVQVVGNAMFARLARVIDRPDLVDEPRFASDALRGDNGLEMSAILTGWAEKLSTREVLDKLAGAGIPVGPIRSPKQAIDDPETWDTGAIAPAHHPDVETPLPLAELVVELGAFERRSEVGFPEAGGDTMEILRTLGFGDEVIRELVGNGILGVPAS